MAVVALQMNRRQVDSLDLQRGAGFTEQQWSDLWAHWKTADPKRTYILFGRMRWNLNRLTGGVWTRIRSEEPSFGWPELPAGTVAVQLDSEITFAGVGVWGFRPCWDSSAFSSGHARPRAWRTLPDWRCPRKGDQYNMHWRKVQTPVPFSYSGQWGQWIHLIYGLRAITE